MCYVIMLLTANITYTRGDPKILGIVKEICLKYLYNFETEVPFKVLPL